MYTLGIDIGSTTSKCAIRRDAAVLESGSIITGGIGTRGPEQALEQVLRDSGVPVLCRMAGALLFGLVLYLAALNAQGVSWKGLFHLE